MGFYRKLNKYLLENQPLIWHTKVIELLSASIFLWLTSYFIGYAITSFELLKKYQITNFYFQTVFVYFHVVFVIIIISVWAIYFYRNSAVRNFYPISKFYLIKLFLLLFIGFLGLICAYIPFTYGVITKTRELYNKNEVQKEVNIINIAAAFLPTNADNYDISQKTYPIPFPLKTNKYNKNTEKWDYFDFYDTNIIKKEYCQSDTYDFEYYTPTKNRQHITTINNQDYIFYTTKLMYDSKDSCKNYTFINQFYLLDTAKIKLRENSILNYSKIILNDTYDENKNTLIFKHKYASKIHELVQNNAFDSIYIYLEEFKRICAKYRINHYIESKIIIKYLKIKNFENLQRIISDYELLDSYKTKISVNHLLQPDKEDFINQIENRDFNQNNMFYATHNLQTVFDNFRYINLVTFNNFMESANLILLLFVTLFVSYFFFLFEFTDIISLLISIPIIGVVLILTFSFIVLTESYFFRSEGNIFLIFEIIMLGIITIHFLLLNSYKANKMILNITLNMSYLIIPYIIPFFISIIYHKTKYSIYDKCGNFKLIEPMDSVFISSKVIFIYVFLSILLFILSIKKWKAKEE